MSDDRTKVGPQTEIMRRIQQALDAQQGPSSFVDNLPFVAPIGAKRCGDHRDFWHNVQSTGDELKDEELGSRYAYLALQAIKAEKFQPLLGWIVLDMIANKCPETIAIGFFQTIADVALGIYQIRAAQQQIELETHH
jgi:hypothetical protein